jgi:ComF family protein
MSGRLLEKLNQTILDLILPPHCVSCQSANSWLCQNCLERIFWITTAVCERCGTSNLTPLNSCRQCQSHPLYYIDGIRAAAVYCEDNPIQPVIHGLKYYNHRAVTGALGKILADTYWRYGFAVDMIMPVPLHQSRLKERGYNQSELLARRLSNLVNVPVNTVVLQRLKKTKTQTQLDADERRQNVADAFACSKSVSSQSILLVDDVCTTGSTLDACARALKTNGAASVWGLTLAKTG